MERQVKLTAKYEQLHLRSFFSSPSPLYLGLLGLHTFLHTLLHLLTGFRNILLQCDPCHHRYLLDTEERGKINHLNQYAYITVFILLLPFAKTRHLPFANG